MSKVLDFLESSSSSKHLLESDFSIELYYFLRSLYSVEDYVKTIKVQDTIHSPYFAYYIPELKSLHINFNKIMDDIKKFMIILKIPEEDKMLAMHLCFFHMVNHEFKHICQEKKKESDPTSTESKLLKLSDKAEKRYSREGILFYKYGIDPIERQAEIGSLCDFLSILKERKITQLETEMIERYKENTKDGYHGYLDDYPAKTFLEYSGLYKFEIQDLIAQLDEYPMTKDNLEYRLQLGLRIDEQEYKQLIKK